MTDHPMIPTSFKKARLRHKSRALAKEVNPATLEAMRLANVEMENRIYALEDLQNAERELRAAVHEWFIREEEELVVDIDSEGTVILGVDVLSVTLHWLRENDKLALHYWAFERVLTGELPRYLCGYCKDPKCGGDWICQRFAADIERDDQTDQELIDHERQVRMPVRVKKAMKLVVDARKRVEK